jgi:hypothetical protein
MAITIFLLLNGLGVVFLFYVLVNFWIEGQRPRNTSQYSWESLRKGAADVFILTLPISHRGGGGLNVIPMPVGGRAQRTGQYSHGVVEQADGTPRKARQLSTR